MMQDVAVSPGAHHVVLTSAYRRAHREREYGSLDRDRDFLVAASPRTRIDDVRALAFLARHL